MRSEGDDQRADDGNKMAINGVRHSLYNITRRRGLKTGRCFPIFVYKRAGRCYNPGIVTETNSRTRTDSS